MIQNNIVSVVVTYNRKEELVKNIEAQLSQKLIPNRLFIIDNCSTDGTYECLDELGFIQDERISYCKMPDNLGGAGGFSKGVEIAHESGAEWIILMDDDGRPRNENCFTELFDYVDKHGLTPNDRIMLNSLVTFSDDEMSFGGTVSEFCSAGTVEDGLLKDIINPFNGTLLSRALVEKIGYPNGDFFIRGDEVDYQRRAINANALIGTVIQANYYHPSRSGRITKKIFGKTFDATLMEPWKEYYWLRNTIYSILNNTPDKKLAKKRARKRYLLHIYSALVVKCKKIEMLKMIKKAYKDAKLGHLGKTVLPNKK